MRQDIQTRKWSFAVTLFGGVSFFLKAGVYLKLTQFWLRFFSKRVQHGLKGNKMEQGMWQWASRVWGGGRANGKNESPMLSYKIGSWEACKYICLIINMFTCMHAYCISNLLTCIYTYCMYIHTCMNACLLACILTLHFCKLALGGESVESDLELGDIP